MSNQPISKGYIKAAVDRYKTTDQQSGQEVMKNRFATIGRYTEWPDDNGGSKISIEIETLPIAAQSGPIKAFLDPEGSQQDQGQGYQQAPVQHQTHQQGAHVQASPYQNNPNGYQQT